MNYISLGETCCVAYQLQFCGVRAEAYPFDWLKTNLNNILKTLETNFENWFDLINTNKTTNLHPHLNDDWQNNMEPSTNLIFKNADNHLFFHEFKVNSDLSESMKTFQEKYQRRIERFQLRVNEKQSTFIIYISKNVQKQKIVRLHQLINYSKLIVIHSKPINFKLDNPEIRFIHDQNLHPDWKISNFDWGTILK